jgi:hypothetical protein
VLRCNIPFRRTNINSSSATDICFSFFPFWWKVLTPCISEAVWQKTSSTTNQNKIMDWNGSVGITTRYWLDGRELNRIDSSGWRSQVRICGHSRAEVASSNSAVGINVCVVNKEREAKCRTIKKKNKVRMKCKQSWKEYKKKSRWGRSSRCDFAFQKIFRILSRQA